MQTQPYHLDNRTIPGRIVIHARGHRPYLAETMHVAELFAQRLTAISAIELPAVTDSTKLDTLYAAVDRVLTRIEFDGLADLLIEKRNQLTP